MSVFGIEVAEVHQHLARVRSDGLVPESVRSQESLDQLESLFALVAASVLCEPGDHSWRRLSKAQGQVNLLRALLETKNTKDFAKQIGATPEDVGLSFERWRQRLSSHRVLKALQHAANVGAKLVVPGDTDWLDGLSDLGDATPHVLWKRGEASPGEFRLAVVGARASTRYGETVTAEFVSELVGRGVSVVSGGAYGIDAMAHRVCLSENAPTFAFMAGGIDRLYPSGHTELHQRIISTGALYSEVPCGTIPSKYRFLARNRLIAAATQVTLVVEAGYRSGSLNTAGHAAALGRAIGAVPGPVTAPSSAGCHRLMRDYSAVCVTTPVEVLELFDGFESGTSDEDWADPYAKQVFDVLSQRPADVGTLAGNAGLTTGEVTRALGLLELEGAAKLLATGWVRTAA